MVNCFVSSSLVIFLLYVSTGKRAKKTASMDNVFSDLIRNKMLDDLENATAYVS